MRRLHCLGCLVASVSVLLVTACSTAEWVHPNKPKDEFAQDYNRCENEAYQNPKVQGGMKFLLQQSIERCLTKKAGCCGKNDNGRY